MIFRRVSSLPRTWSGPFDELERMRGQMERLFNDLSEGTLGQSSAGVFPLINMTESKDNFYGSSGFCVHNFHPIKGS